MDNLGELKGREIVDTVVLDTGFALLLDDGIIIHVASDEVTLMRGPAWHVTWKELKS